MQDRNTPTGRLTKLELAAIDLTIVALQTHGHSFNEVGKDDNPREQMAMAMFEAHQAMWEAHHGGFIQLTDRDREIILQIKQLASRLRSRITLPGLLEARAKIARSG